MSRRAPIRQVELNRPTIVAYLQSLAHKLGRDTISTTDVKDDGFVSPATLINHFGSFSEILRDAGLHCERKYSRNPQVMLSELANLIYSLRRQPTGREIKSALNYSANNYICQFESIRSASILAMGGSLRLCRKSEHEFEHFSHILESFLRRRASKR